MVQRYPSGGNIVDAERPPEPPSIHKAVRLMYAGAAISTVSLVVSLVSIGGTKTAIERAKPDYTTAQVNSLDHFIIAVAIISGVIGIGLWLWMARENGLGRGWARVMSSILFGLATLDLFGVISQPKTVIGLVFPVLTWLVGLATIILLWRKESTAFVKPQAYS